MSVVKGNKGYTSLATLPGKDSTLHQQILGEIEGNIVSGAWPPGYRIPFEVDLAATYGCSRMTVNKVMTQLAKAGLIERRKKSGSFVIQPQAQSAVLEIHEIAKEVQSLNLPHSYKIVKRSVRRATNDEQRRLGCGVGTRVLDVVCLHKAGSRPFCIEDRMINLAAVPDAQHADLSQTTPGSWLLGQVPWSTAEHTITAVSARPEAAELLDVPLGTACLVVERRTWSNGEAVTEVRFTYPGDRHALFARFTPSG